MTQTPQVGHAQTLPTETGITYVRCFQPLSFAVLVTRQETTDSVLHLPLPPFRAFSQQCLISPPEPGPSPNARSRSDSLDTAAECQEQRGGLKQVSKVEERAASAATTQQTRCPARAPSLPSSLIPHTCFPTKGRTKTTADLWQPS